ncbi:hypothetical protein FORC085_2303 [Bacillus cereus]|nr:hypothetical protein FORC085_2303 [Bacillus cereus]
MKRVLVLRIRALFYVFYKEGKDWIMVEKYNVTSKKLLK